VDTLLKHADIAMYQAKESGRGTFKFFSPDHNEKMVQRMQLEQALRRAIEHQELFLDYQPQIDNSTGAITGVEALVRWNHPQLGLLLPGLFITIAEDTGLIIPLGEWVLRTACRQARIWQRTGHRQLRMAVNISPRQFRQRGLMPMIDEILQETGCAPNNLELELTETTLMDNPDEAAALLKALKRRGISLAIDDFGTGYSSLSHLKYFPIDRLKIDRSFINDLTRSPEDSAIVEAIIAMAHRLHLEAVAEGVEHVDQCTMLHNWGCTTSQGFLFSHPLPAQDVTSLLASGTHQIDRLLPSV
jgi:EAL domain-containing protein (putative c-di-GMP-specific phosphodiesterase class I)